MSRIVLAAVTLACLFSVPSLASPKHKGRPSKNSLVLYLKGCERQIETKKQRRELARALADMLHKNAKDLRLKRYKDYEGNKGQWSVTTILTKYYVPRQPLSFDEDSFYRDYNAPEAKEVVQQELLSLKKSMALD